MELVETTPSSIAETVGYEALEAVSSVTDGHVVRIIGGYMVTLHAYRYGLNLLRQTMDADIGVPPHVISDSGLLLKLSDLGYTKTSGNRFEKIVDNYEAKSITAAIIDVLIPTYTSRARNNVKVGGLVLDEVPGLAEAFQRPPIKIKLKVNHRDSKSKEFGLQLPDEISALVLKVMARTVRKKDTDSIDIWRCLEICQAAKIENLLEELPAEIGNQVHQVLKNEYMGNGIGLLEIRQAERLSDSSFQERKTRINALMQRVL